MSNKQIFNRSLFGFALITLLFISQTLAAPRGILFDYFGTGRSDYLLLNETGGQMRWDILKNSVTNPPQTRSVFWGFPFPNDWAVLGDYDGDGRADIGVWRPGNMENPQSYFYIQRSSNPNPNAIFSQPWGSPTDIPLQGGDFDADGKDDFTVAREENGNFSHYILPSGGGGFRRIVFGLTSDFQVTTGADFTGDGRDEIVIYRDGSDGQSILFAADSVTGSLVFAQQWGTYDGFDAAIGGYGDYLGDARADLVHIYGKCGGCPNEGTWWIKETGGNAAVRVVKFGIPLDADFEGDFPLFDSDFDGDGKLDIGVFRASNSTFYSLNSSDGQLKTQPFDGASTSFADNTNLYENALRPQSKTIPAAALRGHVVQRQENGTYIRKQASDFYLGR